MKPANVYRSLFAAIALTACDVDPEAPTSEPRTTSSSAFHARVGAPIDATTANRWIENQRRVDPDDTSSQTLRAEALQHILDTPDCVGISLQYGIDDHGRRQVFRSASTAPATRWPTRSFLPRPNASSTDTTVP